jgi:3-oxoacyl-[acyl-carrier protein] reductase
MTEARTALVTGGSRGIGLETARELAAKGCRVILLARDSDKLKSAREQITLNGGSVDIFSVNFLEHDATQRVNEFLSENGLKPTILINGLGGGFGSNTMDSSAKFEEVMRLNFFVAHELTQLVLENSKRQDWGRFIYFGTLAINHKSASAPYIAAKAALMEYMKTIAKYMGNLSPNILAAAVSPGAISVPGKYLNKIERENPDTLARFFDDNKIPVRRLGTMKEVAEVISFLCDQSSRYLHGCNIQIDGGASN